MKQLFCLLLAVCMMASLCACGKGREKDAGNDTLSSDREVSAPTESIPVPEDQHPRRNLSSCNPMPAKWMWI